MKQLLVMGSVCVLLGVAVSSALGFQTNVRLGVTDWGNVSQPFVECIEYQESWAGSMKGTMPGHWEFIDRVGLRILAQQPTGTLPEPPDLTGFGFTYGTIAMYADGPYSEIPFYADVFLVEDPRDPYRGYYGGLWGTALDETPFEGTVKFREHGDHLVGEVQLVVNGLDGNVPKEVYGQPITLEGDRMGGQFVHHEGPVLDVSGYDLILDDVVPGSGLTGFVNGKAHLETTAYRIADGSGPWAFLDYQDGAMFGHGMVNDLISLIRDLGEVDVWMGVKRTAFDPPVLWDDEYRGMAITSNDHYPEATIAGLFELFGNQVFDGTMEHLWVQPGDLNGDGFVGGDDLDTVRANWGTNPLVDGLTFGDPSRDGFVGGDDLDMVRANWGQHAAPMPPTASAVPEPATLVGLLSLITVTALARRRKS